MRPLMTFGNAGPSAANRSTDESHFPRCKGSAKSLNFRLSCRTRSSLSPCNWSPMASPWFRPPPQQSLEVPPSYGVVAVNFVVPAADGRHWKYAFYKEYATKPTRFSVAAGAETKIDPIGKLEFGIYIRSDVEGLRPGQEIQLQPTWKSTTGLQVNTVYFGDENVERNQPHAVMVMKRDDGKIVGRDHSGFF